MPNACLVFSEMVWIYVKPMKPNNLSCTKMPIDFILGIFNVTFQETIIAQAHLQSEDK